MRAPFTNEEGRPNILALADYASRTAPEQMRTEALSWDTDPTDLLALADILRMGLRKSQHVRALYALGLEQLEQDPSASSSDTDRGGAYAILGNICFEDRDIASAVNAWRKGLAAGLDDPLVFLLLAICLNSAGRAREALELMERLFRMPGDKLSQGLDTDEMAIAQDFYRTLRESLV